MVETLPPQFRPFIARLMKVTQEAERTGDNSHVVSLINEILALPGIARFPEFVATLRVERAHALSTTSTGLTSSTARFVEAELGESRAVLERQLNPELGALLAYIQAIVHLVLGTDAADAHRLSQAASLFRDAQQSLLPAGAQTIARILSIRTEAHLLIAARSDAGNLAGDLPGGMNDLSRLVNQVIQRESASRYLVSPSLAFAYHLILSVASYELWAATRAEGSTGPSGDLSYLNGSFVFAMGAASQRPDVSGPPFCWPTELTIILSQIVVSAAAVALNGAHGEVREELLVFLRRVKGAYTGDKPGDLQQLAKTIAGLVSTHRSLLHAIFGPGRALSEVESKVLSAALESAVPSTPSPNSDYTGGRLLLNGLESTLKATDQELE